MLKKAMEMHHRAFFRISGNFIEAYSKKSSNYKIGVWIGAYEQQSVNDIIHTHRLDLSCVNCVIPPDIPQESVQPQPDR